MKAANRQVSTVNSSMAFLKEIEAMLKAERKRIDAAIEGEKGGTKSLYLAHVWDTLIL